MNHQRYLEIRQTLKSMNSNSPSSLWTLALTLLFFTVGNLTGVIGSLFISISIFRSFSLFHDSVHKSCSKNIHINNSIGFISATLCFLPFIQWKQIHLKHHLWTGNISEDPSMGLVKNYEHLPRWLQRLMDYCWTAYFPLLASLQQIVFWQNSIMQMRAKYNFFSMLSVIMPITFWSCLIVLNPIPVIIGVFVYLLAVELVNFPHHLGLKSVQNEKIVLWEQESVSRSCTYPSWISKYIVLNFNYHIEHHFYPEISWRFLPQVRALLINELPKSCFAEDNFSWTKSERKRKFHELIHDTYPEQEPSQQIAS